MFVPLIENVETKQLQWFRHMIDYIKVKLAFQESDKTCGEGDPEENRGNCGKKTSHNGLRSVSYTHLDVYKRQL